MAVPQVLFDAWEVSVSLPSCEDESLIEGLVSGDWIFLGVLRALRTGES